MLVVVSKFLWLKPALNLCVRDGPFQYPPQTLLVPSPADEHEAHIRAVCGRHRQFNNALVDVMDSCEEVVVPRLLHPSLRVQIRGEIRDVNCRTG